MELKNKDWLQKGLDILHKPLIDAVRVGIQKIHGSNWWKEVLSDLPTQRRNLPEADEGDDEFLANSLDVQACLNLFDDFWNKVFRDYLPKNARSWAKIALDARNQLAHMGLVDMSYDDLETALDAIYRLCGVIERKRINGKPIEPLPSVLIKNLRSDMRRVQLYGTVEGSAAVRIETPVSAPSQSASALPSWRQVAVPQDDVCKGRYKNAEFAADLAQVARSEGMIEYTDPKEFFDRTYMTDGISGLLVEAVKRVSGRGGDPVIQLKTAFGGGKTHSMLALFHALGGSDRLNGMPTLDPVLKSAGVDKLPTAKVVVIVGTALNPTQTREPEDMLNVKINTLWGEIAYQIADQAGDPSLYDLIREADAKGTAPGSQTLKELFDRAGRCVILMDELVAYGRNIYDKQGLPAGSFDNFIVFIQQITEAARASKDSLVVASIPESDSEIGGEAGQQTLRQIQQMFGRIEKVWKPVSADESFEVVRRRLFQGSIDEEARDKICAAYASMYRKDAAIFPAEAKEKAYEERMKACYPIHPEIFDRLYEDWSTIPGFQRTRGVLRIMASLIHELWKDNDGNSMIMPGSIEFGVPAVRDELTRHLTDNWSAIIDREVDGEGSAPFRHDIEDARLGRQQACRRVARAIMFGSAPSSRAQNVRGVESSRIDLAVARPEDNLPVYADAREYLRGSLSYLYVDATSSRYWYDTRPNLRRTAEERASLIDASRSDDLIRTMMKRNERGGLFSAAHIWPIDTSDIPDEQALRIVLLPLAKAHSSRDEKSDARMAAEEIIQLRGDAPRAYRNMIVFAAAEDSAVESLRETAARSIAWRSIVDDGSLNLDKNQTKVASDEAKRAEADLQSRIMEAYRWLLVPNIDVAELNKLQWDVYRLTSTDGSIIERAGKKLKQEDAVSEYLSPGVLKDELEKGLFVDDHVDVKTVWDNFCRRCYLPRLTKYEVLERAIREGVSDRDHFGLADSFDGARYSGLKWNTSTLFGVAKTSLIVKNETVMKQKLEDQNKPASPGVPTTPQPEDHPPVVPLTPLVQTRPKHFDLSAPIDIDRGLGQLQDLWDEVIKHLVNMSGSSVEIRLEVTAKSPDGIPAEVERVITENCKHFGFDEFRVD